MELEIINVKGIKIAVVKADMVVIHETQDALDIMGEATYHGTYKIIIQENHLIDKFFDLKSGLAGDILQKFSTYRVQLAIVGDFSNHQSRSLRDFIFESNKYGHVNFVGSMDEAMDRMTREWRVTCDE